MALVLDKILKRLFGTIGEEKNLTQEDVGQVLTPEEIKEKGLPKPIELHGLDPQPKSPEGPAFPISTELLEESVKTKQEPENEVVEPITRISTRDRYSPPNSDSAEGIKVS